ncbi:unnamed protein product [Calypogeia fissa]
MKSNVATKLSVYLVLLMFSTAILLPGAESVAWVVGDQSEGYTGPFIGRYDEWLVGNPRTVEYASGFHLADNLGKICSALWLPSYLGQNDSFDFNCQASEADITANSGNVGYYVGGLNQNGVTIAQCYVTTQAGQLCDSDTISDRGALACTSFLQCQ